MSVINNEYITDVYGSTVNTFSPLFEHTARSYEIMARSTTVNNDYRQTVTHFINRLVTGGEDNYPRALRKAIGELTDRGLSTVDYRSGRRMRMDSAIRRDLMTEYTNIVQEVEKKVGEDLGCDGVEISAHEHCAVDHAPFQGRTFTNEEFEKLQNGELAQDIEGETFQTDRPIGMFNCRHMWFPVLIGISEPSFSSEELEEIKARNEEGVYFKGEKYTLYEAEQEQRRLETAMRHERERHNMFKEVRDTDPALEREYQRSKERLSDLRNEYNKLGEVLQPKAIRMKTERSYVPKGSTGNKQLPTPQEPNFQPVTSKMLMNMQDDSDRFYNGFTVNQRSSIDYYTYKGDGQINGALFGNDVPQSVRNDIRNIDSLMRTTIINDDIITYRGTDSKWYTDWQVGDIREYKAFMSTSTERSVANEFLSQFASPFMIEVQVPKGTSGLYIGINSKEFKQERELLLNRGMKYRVLVKTENFMRIRVVL